MCDVLRMTWLSRTTLAGPVIHSLHWAIRLLAAWACCWCRSWQQSPHVIRDSSLWQVGLAIPGLGWGGRIAGPRILLREPGNDRRELAAGGEVDRPGAPDQVGCLLGIVLQIVESRDPAFLDKDLEPLVAKNAIGVLLLRTDAASIQCRRSSTHRQDPLPGPVTLFTTKQAGQ